MNHIVRACIVVPVLILAAACCAARAAETGTQVLMDGSTISRDVRIISGRPYIALGDVAKAFNMSVVRSGGEYRLARAGGANQLPGIKGKIATAINSGAWSLTVLSVAQVTGYTQQFGYDKGPIALQHPDDVLFLVKCRLKNATNTTQDVYFDKSSAGNTSLTDDQAHGYTPAAFDSRNDNNSTSKMLPGAAHEFSLVFSVPAQTNIRDLIYTVDASEMDTKTDFRVSLTP